MYVCSNKLDSRITQLVTMVNEFSSGHIVITTHLHAFPPLKTKCICSWRPTWLALIKPDNKMYVMGSRPCFQMICDPMKLVLDEVLLDTPDWPLQEEVIMGQVSCLSQAMAWGQHTNQQHQESLCIHRTCQGVHPDRRAPVPAQTSTYKTLSPWWRTWSGQFKLWLIYFVHYIYPIYISISLAMNKVLHF